MHGEIAEVRHRHAESETLPLSVARVDLCRRCPAYYWHQGTSYFAGEAVCPDDCKPTIDLLS